MPVVSGHCKKFDPTWQTLAKLYSTDKDMVVAQIDADFNKEFVKRYSIETYPKMILWPKGTNKQPIDYQSYWILESLVMFLNQYTSTQRRADGSLAKEAGLMLEFDGLIKRFFDEKEKRDAHFEQLGAIIKSDPEKKGMAGVYYVKVMEKVDAQGVDFIPREVLRLSKLIGETGAVPQQTWEELQVKRNILKQFASHAGVELPSDEPKSYKDEVPVDEAELIKKAKKI